MTSSDSDSFVGPKKNVHSIDKRDSVNNDFINQENRSASKESFQQMMNSNNKFSDMLKNKSYLDFSPDGSSTIVGNELDQNYTSEEHKMEVAGSDDGDNENLEKSLKLIECKHQTGQNELSKISEESNMVLNSDNEIESVKSKSHQNNFNQFKKKGKKKYKETISDTDSSDTKVEINNDLYEGAEYQISDDEYNLSKIKEYNSKKNKNLNQTNQEGISEDSDDSLTTSNTMQNKTINSDESDDTTVLGIKHTQIEQKCNNSLLNLDDENRNSNLSNKISKGNKQQTYESLNDFLKNSLVPPTPKEKPANLEDTFIAESDYEFSKNVEPKKSNKTEIQKNFKAESQLKDFEKIKSVSRIEESHNFLSTFTSNEEVFIIQIPKTLDANDLVGTSISLGEVTQVPENAKKYDCVTTRISEEPIAISCNTNDVHLINLSGNIKIQKPLKNEQTSDFSEARSSNDPFSNTSKQDSLPSSENEEQINLEEHIQLKLRAAIEKYYKEKRMKEELKNTHPEQTEENFENLNQKVNASKKKRNRRAKNVAECEGGAKRKNVEGDDLKKKLPKKDSALGNSSNLVDDTLPTNNTEILSTKTKKK